MIRIDQVTEEDIDQLSQAVEDMVAKEDLDGAAEMIGRTLDQLGIDVARDESLALLTAAPFDEGKTRLDVHKSLAYVMASNPESKAMRRERRKKKGKKWMERIRRWLCQHLGLEDLVKNDTPVKRVVKELLPLVAGALGVNVLNPLFMAALVATVAYLLIKGIEAFCQVGA